MSEFLVIYIKTLGDGGFKFDQNEFILKLLGATWAEHFIRFPSNKKVEQSLVTDENVPEDKIYRINSYAYVIGIVLYMESNTRPGISFVVHQCNRFI